MDAYVYRADIYCDTCGQAIKHDLDCQGIADTGDSDDYPQGPYSDGGGEADFPQHCAGCFVHLGNPLTSDGEAYVREAVAADDGACVDEWRQAYAYLFADT